MREVPAASRLPLEPRTSESPWASSAAIRSPLSNCRQPPAKVDYYGTHTPISQLAQVSTPEAQLIVISPWDPTVTKEIEKALRTSDLGFNPISDGKVLRVPVPPMTEDRRREVCKHLNKVLEEHRTAVRNVRRDGNDALKKLAKDKKVSEDEEKRALEEIQKMTDEEIRRMEELSRKKEAEVMQV